MTVQQIEQTLFELPAFQRLRIARALLDSVLATDKDGAEYADSGNPLLEIAGVFSGGDGNSADRVNELVAEILDRKFAPT